MQVDIDDQGDIKLTMPVIRARSGYASAGGLMGLLAMRWRTVGALATWWKSLGVGRILLARMCDVVELMGVLEYV